MRTQAGSLVVMAARVGAARGTSGARRRRERDACARGGDTRRTASKQRWSQLCITAVMWGP